MGSRGKQAAAAESAEELALRDRQELETWTREAARENVNLESWATSSRGSDSKDLDHQQQAWTTSSGTPKHAGDKGLDHLENWGQQQGRNHHPTGSEAGREGEALQGVAGGPTDSSPPSDSRECATTAGGLDNRSAAAARARSGVSPDYAGRGRSAGAGGYGSSMSSSSGAPCGACKFLRRKCVRGCIFAPYFGAEQGAAKFAAVHKVFGASNVAKLLLHIPTPRRCDAVLTISYEAQARLSDPVYGCVATIFALQQQVASLQAELAMVQAQLADRHAHLQQTHHQQQQRMVQQQQQQQQQGFAVSQAPPEYMQHLADHSTAGLSMGMPGGSSANNPYTSRVKPEDGSYHLHSMPQHQHPQHQHHYDLGMPSSSLQDHSEHSLLESLQKARTGGGMADQPDEGELQALASLLRRK